MDLLSRTSYAVVKNVHDVAVFLMVTTPHRRISEKRLTDAAAAQTVTPPRDATSN